MERGCLKAQSQRNEEIVLRINEVYEHEPLVPYPVTEPTTGCDKVGTQCVEVSLPLTVTPTATPGTVVTTCSSSPTVTCVTAEDGLSCTITVSQRVCVSIPVCFGVVADPETVTIACARTDAESASACTCGTV